MQRGGIDHGNYVTKGMAEVLAAYNCALIADMFGDAPCSQAALIDENGSPVYLTPKMDKQKKSIPKQCNIWMMPLQTYRKKI